MNPKIHLAETKLRGLLTHPLDTRGRAYFVDRGEGRRLAMSDLHGCFETFARMLDKIALTKDDQLFLLGDYVDRGPYSRLLVRYIKSLLVAGFQVFPLRGNHEQLFLDFNRTFPHKLNVFAHRQNAAHMIRESGDLWPGMDRFFSMLPYYYETDHHYLVHAGFDTRSKRPFKSWQHMLWTRQFQYDIVKYEGKRIFHGHVPHHIKRIEAAAASGAKICPIDNACVRSRHEGWGKMVCVDIDSGLLWKVKNADTSPLHISPDILV